MISDSLARFFHYTGITRRHAQLVLLVFGVSLIAKGGSSITGLRLTTMVSRLGPRVRAIRRFFQRGAFWMWE